MNVLSKIKDKARRKKRRVVLPEGTEPRTVQAAKKILAEEIASVTLLGDNKEIETLASIWRNAMLSTRPIHRNTTGMWRS